MNRNITFTADEALIEATREAARSENTTLNQQVRLWLESYVRERQADKATEAVARTRSHASSDGRKFTREEMNERR